MSNDDHTMTVLTGAVFAVAIGVSVQNSSWVMEQFAPKVYEGAVADAYVMRAGHSQNLDVLSNDDFKTGADKQIVSAPTCGTATFVNDKIAFIAPTSCSGEIAFTYCVQANGTCEPAKVALNIRGGDKLVVAEAEPEAERKFERIAPTAVIRKKSATQEPGQTQTAADQTDDRPIADASKPHLPKEQTQLAGRLAPTDEQAPRLTQAAGVVAPPLLAPDFDKVETTVQAKIETTAPQLSFNAVTDVVALADAQTVTTTNPVGLATRTDTRLRGDCDVRLETQVLSGGVIQLAVEAPCFAGQIGRVQHAGLVFDITTDEWGMGELQVPAFDATAEMLVFFGTVQTGARIVQQVPEMNRLRRVALVWNGAADLGLHAFEFGADAGSRGHVNLVNRRDYQSAVQIEGGYLSRVNVREDTFADIYTLPSGTGTAVSQASPDQNLVPELKLALN